MNNINESKVKATITNEDGTTTEYTNFVLMGEGKNAEGQKGLAITIHIMPATIPAYFNGIATVGDALQKEIDIVVKKIESLRANTNQN